MAAAQAKGLSVDALVRAALDRILAEEAGISGPATGAALVAAMQASPIARSISALPAIASPCATSAFDAVAARH